MNMDYRSKKLLSSRLGRIRRWEFWPLWVFYPPIIVWICLLALRHRSATLFTAANPGMKVGGLVDENKAANLLAIQSQYPESVASTYLINSHQPAVQARQQMSDAGLSYPVILKPNSGQRGIGVEVINNQAELEDYFDRHCQGQQSPQKDAVPILLQEHIGGLEFGIFYMREPDQPAGSIFSITEKQFPALQGDGRSTLEQLILEDQRTLLMAEFLLNLHQHQINRVLEIGESLQLVEIGSHCRGSVFVEGSQHITAELEKRVDQISKAIPGYYFGRYDVRVPSEFDLCAGRNLKIIEANGVSSESTNIYDPGYGLIHAYRVLFKQWQAAFRIGAKNRDRGQPPATLKELLKNCSQINRG